MPPLRVHLVHQGFGDYVDGLADGLVSLGPDRVELSLTTIVTGPAPLAGIGQGRPRHRRVSVPRLRRPWSAPVSDRVVRRVVAQPADVIHWQAAGNPWVDLAFLRWLWRADRGPAVVVTVHDMRPHPGDRTAQPGTFAAIRRVAARADRVIVHAPHVRDQAIADGVAAERIEVVAHGELASRYLPSHRLPLTPSPDPVVLFFGRAQGYKGLDRAVAAMEQVVVRMPQARLVVAGDGPSIDEVFPPGRPVPAWCELQRGLVARERVPELFGRAAVVVLPYREASQSGVAALAAGFGRPVVATRVPGLSDIVVDGETGLLVDPGSTSELAEALELLLSDQEEAERLGKGSRTAATTTLSWPCIAATLANIYDGVVTEGGYSKTFDALRARSEQAVSER